MNYRLHYEKLIEKAKDRNLDGYTESHHIIPKSMKGTDKQTNLVNLTAREHFIAHILLVKIYPNEKGLINAVNMMTVSHKHISRINNRMYGWLKERFSERMSELQTGSNNSQYGSIWISKVNENINKKIKKEDLPKFEKLGWERGRNLWNKPVKSKKEIKEDKHKETAYKYWNLYVEGNFTSLRDFARSDSYPFSQANLVKQFNKHIVEYKS